MDRKKIKKTAKRWAEKVAKTISSPYVRRTSDFALGSLQIYQLINKKDPVQLCVGAAAMVSNAIESFEIPTPTQLEHFINENNLVIRRGSLHKIILSSGLANEFFEDKHAFGGDYYSIREIVIDEDYSLYYGLDSKGDESNSNIWDAYYHSKDFPFHKVFDVIWDHYSNGVFLSNVDSTERKGPVGFKTTLLNHLNRDGLRYIGDLDVNAFADEIKKFRAEGISRSYILAGLPGTGKTSFTSEVSSLISNRVVKINPDVAQSIDVSELIFLIKNLEPEILIFDDFDRAAMNSGSEHLLFMLEEVKLEFPNIVIFATVNNYSSLDPALVRPGRFDDNLWFDLPSKEVRKEIAIYYLDQNEVSYDDSLADRIAELTEGLSPAYIKEVCIRLRYKDSSALDSIIAGFKRSLCEVGDALAEMTPMGFEDSSELDKSAFNLESKDEN